MTKKRQPYKKLKPTQFQTRWGVDIHELAKSEGVTSAAINMRVMNYGSPFQRAPAPDMYETTWGMTRLEIAQMLNITLVNVSTRIRNHGTPFIITVNRYPKKQFTDDERVRQNTYKGWLHPLHPNYLEWQAECQAKREAIQWLTIERSKRGKSNEKSK